MALSLAVPCSALAQPREGRYIDVDVGVGFSSPEFESEIGGTGFLLKGEYVFGLFSWFGLRPYAGGVFTWPNDEEICDRYDADCDVSSKVFLLGGKARLAAPIPYVAPFLELGLGGSLGAIRTQTLAHSSEVNGATYHVPFSVGLALGKDHAVELAFEYLFHPAADHVNGGISLGLSFPAPGGAQAPASAEP